MSAELDIQLLQRLHSLLRQRSDLNERLEKGPRAVKIAENNLLEYQKKVDQIADSIRSTKIKSDEKQLQLSERESHIEKLGNQRNQCDSNREYQLLTDQIAADEQANAVLQDEILELLEKIEELEATEGEEKQNLKLLEKKADEVRSRIQSELESVQRDLGAVNEDLVSAETKLPGEVRVEFKRLATAMGEDALAKVEDKTCGHCFQIINAQMYSQLVMSKPVFCGGCGSLMYMPKTVSTAE